jgi:transposase-like protein
MKKKKHSPQQIVTKLREADALLAHGKTVEEVAKVIGVATVTYFRWRKLYGDSGPTEVKRLRNLEKENQRLKKLVADLSLDNQMLKEVLSGKC